MFVIRTDLVGPTGRTATIARHTPQYHAYPLLRVHLPAAAPGYDQTVRADQREGAYQERGAMARMLAEYLDGNTRPSTVAEYHALLDGMASACVAAPGGAA